MTIEDWISRAEKLGPELSEYADRHDEDGTFVEESYEALRADGYFAALVPTELGGQGASIEEVCHFVRVLAHACPSTALAFSMHTHLVAATLYKHNHGQPGERLLRRVAQDGLILVSTGAGDWLDSNGELKKVKGGYEFSAKKPFASGSPAGSLMITSGRYEDPERGSRVLHFPLPFAAPGVEKGSDWDTHGMRGTGSHTVSITGTFIAEESIALDRPRGPWHPAFDVIATLALPILMSPYVGIAERATQLAVELARDKTEDIDTQLLCGELSMSLSQVQALFSAHLRNTDNGDFRPSKERTAHSFALKTALADACIATVEKAMETVGGAAFFRKKGIERCLRDVRGSVFHALQPKRATRFCGAVALGREP